jgi:hypothetical protein
VPGRRKKVIRSRIGYARAAAPGEAHAPHASTLADALVVSPTAAAAEAAPTPLQRQPSAAGSEGGGSYNPTPASSRPGSRGSQEPALARTGSRAGSAAMAAAGEAAGEAAELEGRPPADPQHLTALQQHVARLDIRLDLPAGAAGRERAADSQSSSSRRSTGGWGAAAGGCCAPCWCA